MSVAHKITSLQIVPEETPPNLKAQNTKKKKKKNVVERALDGWSEEVVTDQRWSSSAKSSLYLPAEINTQSCICLFDIGVDDIIMSDKLYNKPKSKNP